MAQCLGGTGDSGFSDGRGAGDLALDQARWNRHEQLVMDLRRHGQGYNPWLTPCPVEIQSNITFFNEAILR